MPAGAFLLYALLARLYTGPAWQNLGSTLPGSSDAVQTIWFLAWVPHAIAHHLNPWVTTAINFPDGANVMCNTSQLLAGLLMAPVTETLGPVTAYVVLITAELTLTAWVGFLALRRWLPAPAALLSGLLYGFSPYMLPQTAAHANLGNGITLPIVAILLDNIFVRRRGNPWISGALLGFVVACQLLLSEEILIVEFLASVVMVAVLAVRSRHRIRTTSQHGLRAAIATAVTASVLCAWPLATQLLGTQRLSTSGHDPDSFSTDVLAFLIPTSNERLAPPGAQLLSDHFAGNWSEWNAYLGIPLAALLLFTIWHGRRDRFVQVVSTTVAAVTLLSMGPHLHLRGHVTSLPLPWDLIARIPLIGAALPSRMILAAWLGIALLAGLGLRDVWGSRPRGRIIAAALATGCAATLLPASAVPAVSADIPPYFSSGTASALSGARTIIAPIGTENNASAMLWQASASLTMTTTGGYVLTPPPAPSPLNQLTDWLRVTGETDIGLQPTDSALTAYRQALGDAKITTFILGPAPHHDRLRAELTALAGHPPIELGGVEIWTGAGTS